MEVSTIMKHHEFEDNRQDKILLFILYNPACKISLINRKLYINYNALRKDLRKLSMKHFISSQHLNHTWANSKQYYILADGIIHLLKNNLIRRDKNGWSRHNNVYSPNRKG